MRAWVGGATTQQGKRKEQWRGFGLCVTACDIAVRGMHSGPGSIYVESTLEEGATGPDYEVDASPDPRIR